jgi:hypothetical protein
MRETNGIKGLFKPPSESLLTVAKTLALQPEDLASAPRHKVLEIAITKQLLNAAITI